MMFKEDYWPKAETLQIHEHEVQKRDEIEQLELHSPPREEFHAYHNKYLHGS